MEFLLIAQVLLCWLFSNVFSLTKETFKTFEKNPIQSCPDLTLTENEGTISSPFYPSTYPSHLSCTWHIQGNAGDIVTIRFDDLDIEESCCCESQPCCYMNWLKIGTSTNGTERKFCGKEIPYYHTILTNSNKLWIKFHISFFKDGGRGFRFHYKKAPSSSLICKSTEFKCVNTHQCVPSIVRCNGFPDCGDGSDEHHCSNRCSSGRSCESIYQCYDAARHCDGTVDCPDFSDELDCGFCNRNLTRCGVNSTKCYNPLTQRCDSVFDCVNGEDEIDCSGFCPGKITCESKRGCYSIKQRCNGVTQCEDASDEKNCVSELCNYEHGGFLCDNGRCIQEVWTCDRTDDCGDLSDEKNCLRNSVLTAALMGSLICALLLVIAISCTCRLHALRMLETRLSTTRETPLSRLSREFFFREPPPSYAVAVQGDSRRNLCVENLHYGVPRTEISVHRSRRSRRSRHPRSPPYPTPDRNIPEPSIPSTDESLVSDVSSEQTDQTLKVEESVTDSSRLGEYVSGDVGKSDDTEDDSPVVAHNPSGENVILETIAGLTNDPEGSSVGSCDTRFYCDSDTDPLIV